ncbi:MarR family winged helix-turn-helix transcriptional regulator [Comamonas guangdongensis]|uniref:MarR family winged helix-turn-helix transcriptional regulator n=1 Tax=Comamonas guangdongensis TaxID=510515 RepID=A0ABV4A0A6_9BURK
MQTKSQTEAPAVHDLAQVRSRFGRLIGSVYRQWRRQVDLSFKAQGLSDATRMPLVVLYAKDQALLQKELAQALHLETSSLVRVLDQLRRMELVDWSNDPDDRRTKRIALTPGGREAAAQIVDKSLEIEQQILAGLSAEELAITRATLEKIARRFGEL